MNGIAFSESILNPAINTLLLITWLFTLADNENCCTVIEISAILFKEEVCIGGLKKLLRRYKKTLDEVTLISTSSTFLFAHASNFIVLIHHFTKSNQRQLENRIKVDIYYFLSTVTTKVQIILFHLVIMEPNQQTPSNACTCMHISWLTF